MIGYILQLYCLTLLWPSFWCFPKLLWFFWMAFISHLVWWFTSYLRPQIFIHIINFTTLFFISHLGSSPVPPAFNVPPIHPSTTLTQPNAFHSSAILYAASNLFLKCRFHKTKISFHPKKSLIILHPLPNLVRWQEEKKNRNEASGMLLYEDISLFLFSRWQQQHHPYHERRCSGGIPEMSRYNTEVLLLEPGEEECESCMSEWVHDGEDGQL